MSNWCENELTVTGPSDELARFRDAAKSRPGERNGERVLSEESFIPYPEDYRVLDEANAPRWEGRESVPIPPDKLDELKAKGFNLTQDGFNQGGYDWCIKNWGTKWGFCQPALAEERPEDRLLGYGAVLVYHFETAWSPPKPLILRMSAMFPGLTFELKYWEGGMGFQGSLTCEAGQEVENWTSAYSGDRGG